MKIFVSHAANTVRTAVRFKELLQASSAHATVFLSSDWESIPSGSNWLQEIEQALSDCDFFIALVTKTEDAKRLWINYEVGFARGRLLYPKIIIFSGIPAQEIQYPLSGLHLLFHGDTNRWLLEFSQMGLTISPHIQAELAKLFETSIPDPK
jgi:TIR domain